MNSTVQNVTLPLEISRVALPLRNAVAFLMLGGASLILMLVFFVVRQPQILMRDDVRMMLQELSGGTLLFVVLLSYPHFMWSYRFAYQQGFAFIKRHSWQLIVYPLVVTGLLTLCVLSWNHPVSNFPILRTIENNLQMIGVSLNWSLYKGAGQLLFAGMLIAQVIMSGHHYCMQAFGVALAGGEEHGYKLTDAQKKILRINLYALWAMNLLSGLAFLSILNNRTFAYHSFQLPAPVSMASYVFFAITFALVVFKVILPQKKLPPFQAAIPILSIWIWLQPFVQPYGYQFLVVPIAHGAQNLFFAYKVELNNFDPRRKSVTSALGKAFFLVALSVATMTLGYFSFHTIPVAMDKARFIADLSPNFFFLAAFILISTHHYILDSVVWRHDSRARIVLQPPETAIQ